MTKMLKSIFKRNSKIRKQFELHNVFTKNANKCLFALFFF